MPRSLSSVARRIAVVSLVVFGRVLAEGDSAPVSQSGPVFEEWAIVYIDGKRCGFESTLTTAEGNGFRTVHTEEFVFKRQNAKLKMVDTSTIHEDADGVVHSYKSISSGNGSNIESSGTRDGNDMVVSSRGQTRRYPLPPLSALGPEMVRRLTQGVPLQPGQTFSFQSFSSDYPQAAITTAGKIVQKETHEAMGRSQLLWKIDGSSSLLPGITTTSWVDDQGNDIAVMVKLPTLGTLHEVVSNRAACMRQPEGAEVFEASLLHPQRAIPHPRDLTQAVYRLGLSGTTERLHLWDGDSQKVLSSGPGWSEVEVTAPVFKEVDATWKLPRADEPDLHSYLEPTSYLESASPIIQKLARDAIGDEKNPVRAARLIQTFVRAYITKKDLKIAFASAEETANSREGDCTEHAVLCAAIGRAAGLPTRCVVGFGYIPPNTEAPTLAKGAAPDTGTFAFHMWAEAWIGPNEWMPMDAALNGFDVAHIAITKSALDDVNPLVDLDASVIQLLENLKIEVVRTK